MAVDILTHRPFQPTFEPIEAPAIDGLAELETAVDTLYNQAGVNLGLIIANLQQGVEQKKDEEIRSALALNGQMKDQAKTLNDFLKVLEGELANPNAKKINLANESTLVAQVNQLVPHALLQKTEWTRDEAEALCKIIPRRSEQLMNEINDRMREISHLVEDRHELLTIFRDLLKMLREMHDVFIRNQKV